MKYFVAGLISSLFIALFLTTAVYAADTLGQGLLNRSVGPVGLESSLSSTVGTAISVVLGVVGSIFLVLTVAGGIMWMTASGNDEQIKKAKNIIVSAAIGLLIVVSAYTITFFVTSKVGSTSSYSCTNSGGTCQGSGAPCPGEEVNATCPGTARCCK